MSKLTKRIPYKFIFNHPDGRFRFKEVLTNDIENYLKKYNGKTGYGIKWELVPLEYIEIEGVEYFKDARGNLRESKPEKPTDICSF
jgi:hypothetical protein